MNKQPYYHAAEILFTATEEIGPEALKRVLQEAVRTYAVNQRSVIERIAAQSVIPESIEVESIDAEPGDPADLVI